MDVNSMKPLDNLCHPVSVIKEAEELAAQASALKRLFHGERNHLRSAEHGAGRLQKGEKIILPRNVHRSVINALVLSGAERCTSTRR